MKKSILIILISCLCATAFAQKVNDPNARWTKTETNFNAAFVSHRHIVMLEKGNKMIVEMFGLDGYEVLGNVDTILRNFSKEVSLFEDSLIASPSSNLRIDCAYSNPDHKMFRVQNFPASGEMFVNRKGVVAPLKIEQDTIRILIQQKVVRKLKGGKEWKTYNPVQLTFLLNDHNDINKLIEQKEPLQHYIDTMRAVMKPLEKMSPYIYRSTIVYKPYDTATERRLVKYDRLTDEQYHEPEKNHNRVVINWNIGAGLVRNTLAPVADLGLEYRNPWIAGEKDYRLFGIYASSYMVFDRKADGSFKMSANIFLNGELGSSYNGDLLTLKYQRITLGGGYLINPDGNYFKNTTVKLFMNFTLRSGVTISPEIIATDNFKQVFPGITVKVF